MTNGRPLRFLALTLGGWTALRMVMLWQAAVPAGAPMPLPLIGRAVADERLDPAPWLRVAVDRPPIAAWPAARRFAAPTASPAAPAIARAVRHADPNGVALALAALVRFGTAVAVPDQQGAITPPLRPTPLAPARSRLAGSAWLIARNGGAGGGILTGGQLGASQAGARLTYALGSGRRVALSARIATPLSGQGREAGLGLDWQPTRAPLHLIAEQRVSLDGGHGGPVVMAVGGLNPTPVVAGFRLEAYAEAGAIARRSAEGGVQGFGDGAARLTRPVASIGILHIDLGAGAWGAAQRGARRLDIGPTLGIVAPLGRKAMRLTLDWRERVAGDARPGSGPALSVGTDF